MRHINLIINYNLFFYIKTIKNELSDEFLEF